MTNLLINCADRAFYQAQKLNTQTGLGVGGFDGAIAFRRHHLDPMFVARNNRVLDCPTGAGWWLWKPCIVLASLHRALGEGDVLFYAHSGCHFIGNAPPIIKLCQQRPDKPILLFSMRPDYLNRCFVKRDCFHYMGLDTPRFTDAIHTCASFFVCKKTPLTVSFFEEWLRYAQDPRILTNAPNQCGLPDYPGVFQHRNDQAILSLLGRKYEIPTFPDISQQGNTLRPPEIPQIIEHTRWGA